ncbi:hypothetical protein [Hymenobacter nivis]|uniref:hypothetical protein n=1 Tax=Hymenobacter nivis TaxID=1850093 RepID=UPI001B879C25|nr:hypothetical protein [Hymenobacter nivis]
MRRRERRTLLWVAPLACYAAGVAMHSAGGLWFWRALAYLAVRQQYGFFAAVRPARGPRNRRVAGHG